MTAAQVFGSLSPLDVARHVARYALHRLDEVDPTFADEMRQMARSVGQGYWLDPAPENGDEVLTVAQVAAENGVGVSAVNLWIARGVSDHAEGRWYLPRRPDGKVDRADLDEFLRVRDGHTPTVVIADREFCRCGHDDVEHDHGTGRCMATLPDRCSCSYYVRGKRNDR